MHLVMLFHVKEKNPACEQLNPTLPALIHFTTDRLSLELHI
jgi:hypothetical protein